MVKLRGSSTYHDELALSYFDLYSLLLLQFTTPMELDRDPRPIPIIQGERAFVIEGGLGDGSAPGVTRTIPPSWMDQT